MMQACVCRCVCVYLVDVGQRLLVLHKHLGKLQALIWPRPHHTPQKRDPIRSITHLQTAERKGERERERGERWSERERERAEVERAEVERARERERERERDRERERAEVKRDPLSLLRPFANNTAGDTWLPQKAFISVPTLSPPVLAQAWHAGSPPHTHTHTHTQTHTHTDRHTHSLCFDLRQVHLNYIKSACQ